MTSRTVDPTGPTAMLIGEESPGSGSEKPADATAGQPETTPTAASASRWAAPSKKPELAGDQVHVWCAVLDGSTSRIAALGETLSASEQRRAARFQFDRDRNRFIIRRGLLRRILGQYLNVHPAQLAFTYESRGKPALAGTADDETLQFNLSHSDGLALFAVARRSSIGVDVERIRPIPEADQIAAKFFSAREGAMLCALSPPEKLEAFFNCWTRKEAYLKATGDGIADALAEIEVSLAPRQNAELLRIAGDAQAASLWALHPLSPAAGFVGALAVQSKELKPVCWHWPEID